MPVGKTISPTPPPPDFEELAINFRRRYARDVLGAGDFHLKPHIGKSASACYSLSDRKRITGLARRVLR
jgi:hypothetical protein